jgi:hypothetical protein
MSDDPIRKDSHQPPTVGFFGAPVPQPTEKTTSASAGPPASRIPEGERFGEFVLLGEVGRGGMGVVYRAYEVKLDRVVAVKMILPGALASEAELQRFNIEASATARLHHPHIVKVHRVGIHEDRHYYSMDFIEGPSLAQRLAHGPMPSRPAARYVAMIARAIHHAHEQGILHRDLKPANILVDAADQPHVTDFGLAKQFTSDTSQTRTGALMGTPGSMAPEQAAGEKNLTPACDVYGLGALLYELLTARPPFKAETVIDTLYQVMEHEPVPPRLLNPRVDRDLETICLKCLRKAPRDRYGSAAELAADLDRYLHGESIQARSLNMVDQLARMLGRSQYDLEFRHYGSMLYVFAVIVGTAHIIKHFLIAGRQAVAWIVGVQVVQFALLILVVGRWRRSGSLVPRTTAERQLWSVWISYVVTCALMGLCTHWLYGEEALYEGKLYPYYALVGGMAFFVLGSSYWGRCYAISMAFLVLGLVLAWFPGWGALGFGGVWVMALVTLGTHLRGLGLEKGEQEEIGG